MQLGRYCQLNGQNEVTDLQYGMDFREHKYRREVFLRFYEFHLKYRAHAGAIYYVFPFLFDRFQMDMEQKLWFAFINGCSQNVITTHLIIEAFPDLHSLDIKQFTKWYRAHYAQLGWDTDRRYEKNKLEDCILDYKKNIGSLTQEAFFLQYMRSADFFENFKTLWPIVKDGFKSFGRLATFSYLEYLRLAGLPIDCPTLFLDDVQGSKSHRNGLCKVLGRDDLDWHHNDVTYEAPTLKWLDQEAHLLLSDARARFQHPNLSNFTLETTLCCYKSWHRKNRRYPNVYNDMFYERIRYAQRQWKEPHKFDLFWESRLKSLPKHLLLEFNPKDLGVNPVKQNHYRSTGQVIMMDKEWQCFSNNYNDYTKSK